MQVTLLAEALAGVSGHDGRIGAGSLERRLSQAGLGELAAAVSSLAGSDPGQGLELRDQPSDDHPWF